VALPKHDRQHIGDGAVLDHDAAVHIGFAESQHGIGEDGALGGPGDKADRRRPAGAIPARKDGSCRGGDPEIPGADQPCELHPKQPIHRPPPTASTPSPAKPTLRLPGCETDRARLALRRNPQKQLKQSPVSAATCLYYRIAEIVVGLPEIVTKSATDAWWS